MNTGLNKRRVLGASLTAMAIGAVAMAPGAMAADEAGDVEVVNTETVQVYVSPTGEIERQAVYEQLSFTGQGSVDIANPVEAEGLRNLDGFGGVSAEDGVQSVSLEVDGYERLRSVSDYTGDLPLEFEIAYFLDGEEVEPGDLVGESGSLEVVYTVRNITAQPQEVSFPDGQGGTTTETVDVPIPIVGSMSTTVPSNFTDVTSEQANVAGDGQGGTKLSFTMTLFPPLGSDEMEFSYRAQVSDAVVPATSVTALPVNPLEVPTFKTAGDSYQSGSETGIKLASGATELDTNLLKLRDGAADLLGGLIQLSDGSDELAAGLSGEAAPGAQQLADGAGDLRDGLGQIDDGAGELSDGAGRASDGGRQLADGAGDLRAGLGQIDAGAGELSDGAGRLAAGTGDALTGSQKLEAGLKQISEGLGQLSSVQGLPKALAGAQQLKVGVDQIVAGIGSTSDAPTASVLGGLQALETGLTSAEGGSAQILAGLRDQLRPGLGQAKGGVDQVQSGLAAAVANGGSLDQLFGGLESLRGFCDVDEPVCEPTITGLQQGVTTSKSNLTDASNGLLQVSGGLATAIGALDTQLIPGATQLNQGIASAKGGATQLKTKVNAELRPGLLQVQGGLAELVTGLTGAVGGADQLAAGANDAYAGSGDLADGLTQIDGGANDLADGAGRLAAGTGDAKAGSQKLAVGADELASGLTALSAGALRLAGGTGDASEGSQLLADGAGDLAEGLGDAADGSQRLADGLAQAEEGAPQIVDGAGRLSEEGMSQLIEAGEDTAQDYGKLYATIKAGADRADAEKMAYGAPEGAQGLTAYSYELLGDDGQGSRNTKRGIAALALLGVGAGGLLLRRRLA